MRRSIAPLYIGVLATTLLAAGPGLGQSAGENAGFSMAEILSPVSASECGFDSVETEAPLTVETVLTTRLETRDPLAYSEVVAVRHAAGHLECVRIFLRAGENGPYTLQDLTVRNTPYLTELMDVRAFVYCHVQDADREFEPVLIVQVTELRLGTGRERTEHLYVYDNVSWHKLELPDLASIFLPTLDGEDFGGDTPATDFSRDGLRAWLHIYSPGDPNCCPSGGRLLVDFELLRIDPEHEELADPAKRKYRLRISTFEREPRLARDAD